MERNIGNTGVVDRPIDKIDKIDIKAEHKKLIDIYYRLELLYFVKALLCSSSFEK
jgi:hypothetical protein